MLTEESTICPVCNEKGFVVRHTPRGAESKACGECGGYGRIAKPGTPDPRQQQTIRVAPGQQPSLIVGTPTPAPVAAMAPHAVADASRDALNEAVGNLAKNLGVSVETARSMLGGGVAKTALEGGPRVPVTVGNPPFEVASAPVPRAPIEDLLGDPEPEIRVEYTSIDMLPDIPEDPNDEEAVQRLADLDEDDEDGEPA